ncbi:MAG: molybdopterin-guanine dinucleotide biosynthesis protein MobB [Spirochaetales bacterium]|nr:molybdopterin-guanine dinucleotide biosynthesis protein MobB [Spirochaetales bacterium]
MKEIPIFSIIGWSDTGKTTLIGDLIELYAGRGLKTAALKKTHKAVELDHEGSDSKTYRDKGAFGTCLASPEGGVFFLPDFSWSPETLRRVFHGADVIICEGLKLDGYPVIQTCGKAERMDELKGSPTEWSILITDSVKLKMSIPDHLKKSNIHILSYRDIHRIPDLIS